MLIRYYFRDLKGFARGRNATFRTKPTGRVWQRIQEEDVSTRKGVLSLENKKPVLITYGNYVYMMTDRYIEIEIPELENIENPYSFAGFRLATFSATMGLIKDSKQVFDRARRQEIVGEEVIGNEARAITNPVDRRVRDTDTLSAFPIYEVVTYPHFIRILRYIFFRPRISENVVIGRLLRLIGISETEVMENILRLKAEKLIVEVVYGTYPKDFMDIALVKIVSDNEGKFGFSELRGEIQKFGLSSRGAFNLIFKAIDKGYVEEKTRKFYSTNIGREAIKTLPEPKLRRGLLVSEKGRERIGL